MSSTKAAIVVLSDPQGREEAPQEETVSSNEPFHTGEIAIQERTGERNSARRHGAGISSRIMPGALPFLERQRLLAVSAVADDGELWTSVWCGEPGFVRSTDGQHVSIQSSLMDASPHDPVRPAVAIGRALGMGSTARRPARSRGLSGIRRRNCDARSVRECDGQSRGGPMQSAG